MGFEHSEAVPPPLGEGRLCFLSLGNTLVPGRLGVGSCKQPSPGTPACRSQNTSMQSPGTPACRSQNTNIKDTSPDVDLLLPLSHSRKIHQKGSALPWPFLHPFHYWSASPEDHQHLIKVWVWSMSESLSSLPTLILPASERDMALPRTAPSLPFPVSSVCFSFVVMRGLG